MPLILFIHFQMYPSSTSYNDLQMHSLQSHTIFYALHFSSHWIMILLFHFHLFRRIHPEALIVELLLFLFYHKFPIVNFQFIDKYWMKVYFQFSHYYNHIFTEVIIWNLLKLFHFSTFFISKNTLFFRKMLVIS